MNCPYCQSILIKEEKKADLLCPQCPITSFSLDQSKSKITLITLTTILHDYTYYLLINPAQDSKAVLAWQSLDLKSHDWKLLPKEVSQTVTPYNFPEKLKIYLTFL